MRRSVIGGVDKYFPFNLFVRRLCIELKEGPVGDYVAIMGAIYGRNRTECYIIRYYHVTTIPATYPLLPSARTQQCFHA